MKRRVWRKRKMGRKERHKRGRLSWRETGEVMKGNEREREKEVREVRGTKQRVKE